MRAIGHRLRMTRSVRSSILRIGFFILFLIYPAFCSAADTPTCTLPKGLYLKLWRLELEYDRQVGSHYRGPRVAIGGRIFTEERGIYKVYSTYFNSLAKASLGKDNQAYQSCLLLATGDPYATPVAGLVAYLHGGRGDPAAFIASLPTSGQQLAAFMGLDDMATGDTPESPSSLPGISLPDGLAERITHELFELVLKDDFAGAREYFHLYAHADGGYAEYFEDQLSTLFLDHPEVVLRQWQALSPYVPRILLELSATTWSPSDRKRAVDSLASACHRYHYPSCPQALRIFH
jgi:hypothetical protein